ncbi:hypothetical protein [Persephonella sp.]
MRYLLLLTVLFYFSSYAGEIEEACSAYVSILDSCDVESSDCEKLGKSLEERLLQQKVDPKTAEHFKEQCIKICDLPEGSYPNIRDDIRQACIKSLKE